MRALRQSTRSEQSRKVGQGAVYDDNDCVFKPYDDYVVLSEKVLCLFSLHGCIACEKMHGVSSSGNSEASSMCTAKAVSRQCSLA